MGHLGSSTIKIWSIHSIHSPTRKPIVAGPV
jgi:hypothetical protein